METRLLVDALLTDYFLKESQLNIPEQRTYYRVNKQSLAAIPDDFAGTVDELLLEQPVIQHFLNGGAAWLTFAKSKYPLTSNEQSILLRTAFSSFGIETFFSFFSSNKLRIQKYSPKPFKIVRSTFQGKETSQGLTQLKVNTVFSAQARNLLREYVRHIWQPQASGLLTTLIHHAHYQYLIENSAEALDEQSIIDSLLWAYTAGFVDIDQKPVLNSMIVQKGRVFSGLIDQLSIQ